MIYCKILFILFEIIYLDYLTRQQNSTRYDNITVSYWRFYIIPYFRSIFTIITFSSFVSLFIYIYGHVRGL